MYVTAIISETLFHYSILFEVSLYIDLVLSLMYRVDQMILKNTAMNWSL